MSQPHGSSNNNANNAAADSDFSHLRELLLVAFLAPLAALAFAPDAALPRRCLGVKQNSHFINSSVGIYFTGLCAFNLQ